MAKTLTTAPERKAPPPFWQQLPRVFTYPANLDSLVKIFAYGIAAAIAVAFLPLGPVWAILAWFAFYAYCFGILERTARGHLIASEVSMDERTSKDRRPIKQVGIFVVFFFFVGVVAGLFGKVAGQVTLLVVCFVIPASIMELALEEKLGAALNPVRLASMIAGIGMPYLALVAFLFLLLLSSAYLGAALTAVLPKWAGYVVGNIISMYFMVSMYYLMGYALYQNHSALGIHVQVDTAMAHQQLVKSSGGKVEPELLGPETRALIADGKLDEGVAHIEGRMKREWDNNKLHDQYLKVLFLQGNAKTITREVNEYVPKLMREKKLARAVEVYEAARKAVPDLLLTDSTLILPLATQAAELRRDATAFELLKAFDKRFPDSADIPGVYFLAARLLLDRSHDYAMAQKIFAHLLKKYPQHPLAAEAMKLQDLAAKMAAGPAASRPA